MRLGGQIAYRACYMKSHVHSPIRFKTMSIEEEDVEVGHELPLEISRETLSKS